MWVAPAKGSGCVRLSAMIYEGKDSWFSDVGGLSKIICEDMPDKNTRKVLADNECCACDEAKYNVRKFCNFKTQFNSLISSFSRAFGPMRHIQRIILSQYG